MSDSESGGAGVLSGELPTLSVITALWRRPNLSQLFLQWYAELQRRVQEVVNIHLLAVGSEAEATRRMALEHGWDYVEAPNCPLTAKWNAASSACRSKRPDAVMIVGSDDFVCEKYIKAAVMAMGASSLFGLRDLWFFDSTPPYRLGYWPGYVGPRGGEPIGAGRTFRRDLLEALEWKLWEPSSPRNSGLDRQSLERVERTGIAQVKLVNMDSIGAFAVDIKSAEGNLWRWDQFAYSKVLLGRDGVEVLQKHGISGFFELTSTAVGERSEVVARQSRLGMSLEVRNTTDAAPILTLIVTAHNAAGFVEKCIRSVAEQRMSNWRIIFVDDASSDGTADALSQAVEELGVGDQLTLVRHTERRYKTRSTVDAVRESVADDDIVVMVDGDDWLADGRALEKLAAEYAQGWDVVWGNWVGTDGTPGTSWHLNPLLPPRRQPWASGHLFSFRARLLKAVPDTEFQDDQGNWFRCACDQAIALPVLERSMRRKHLEEVLYVYNRDNPNSHDRQGRRVNPLVSEEQTRASQVLYGRPARVPPWDQEFFVSHRFEFVRAAMASAERFGGDAVRRHVQEELARLTTTEG